MSGRIEVFYEDSRESSGGGFELHSVVLACVADLLSMDDWRSLERAIGANPKNGNSNVLGACRRDVPKMSAKHVAAVLDGDKLKDLLGADPATEFRNRVPDLRVELFVIDRNTETLVRALRDVGLISTSFDAAIDKDPMARDKVFAAAASGPPSFRAALQTKVPSLKHLVDALADWHRTLRAP